MAIENMPLGQLERMAKNGVLVAKKELERRQESSPAKRCTRCENGQPKDEWTPWTGKRYWGGILLCDECRVKMKV